MTFVAYQGEPGAFSELAAKKFFGSGVGLKPLSSFRDVFEFASRGSSRFGVVPIENSVFGSIHQNYDLLLSHRLFIVGEVALRIQLHLMSLPGVALKKIRLVYSQPQALGQCEEFLRKLKGVKVVAFQDTAGAARMIRQERRKDVAAIASAAAARTYRLQIIRKNVESNSRNFTRFVVLSKRQGFLGAVGKTSLVFATRNIPGSLFQSLAGFALHGINLVKIESRPLVGKPWEYLFYLDVEGTSREKPILRALNHLKEVSTFVRILGTYPKGKTFST
ncbi:MAG TPA: prephenate dehydratase [Bacteroidota bacterium]|nr:prephenate dehydratase [Bacteroidota bacterium]